MLITLSTDKSVREAATALQAAVEANHFGVMHIHDLKDSMWKKGVNLDHKCLVFEICQPQQAKKVLDENMSISTALPCRISIYEEGGKTFLATLKPTNLLAIFNTPQLTEVVQEVEATLVKIIREAAAEGTGGGCGGHGNSGCPTGELNESGTMNRAIEVVEAEGALQQRKIMKTPSEMPDLTKA